jgi:hypothetical protein
LVLLLPCDTNTPETSDTPDTLDDLDILDIDTLYIIDSLDTPLITLDGQAKLIIRLLHSRPRILSHFWGKYKQI